MARLRLVCIGTVRMRGQDGMPVGDKLRERAGRCDGRRGASAMEGEGQGRCMAG